MPSSEGDRNAAFLDVDQSAGRCKMTSVHRFALLSGQRVAAPFRCAEDPRMAGGIHHDIPCHLVSSARSTANAYHRSPHASHGLAARMFHELRVPSSVHAFRDSQLAVMMAISGLVFGEAAIGFDRLRYERCLRMASRSPSRTNTFRRAGIARIRNSPSPALTRMWANLELVVSSSVGARNGAAPTA